MQTVNTASITELEPLLERARQARLRAYAPYSKFFVGAAVQARDGRIFEGCNVENAAYGLCNCAERSALFAAVSAGCRPGDFVALAVIGDCEGPISPCGACRQVIFELCEGDMPVLLGNLQQARQATTVATLLPGGFGPSDLGH